MDSKNILGSVGDSIASFFGRKNKPAVMAPPHLTSPVRFPYGAFQFKFQVPKGVGYDVHVSSNLATWAPILSGKSSGEPVDCVDSEASGFSYRFYRVQTESIWSDNVVGYVTTTVPPGYSMIANPLQATSNAVSDIFSGMADGTMLNKFDTHLFKLTENAVENGKWINPDETLAPGEGAIFFNPTTDFKTINFAGEVMQGELLMPIASGFSVRSSQIPKPGRLNSDLGFPINEGDVIHLFDRDRQKYVIFEYNPKNWESNPPVLGVGEAFWIGKTIPGNWVQRLVIQ
ncbi:MAG: hypothetical protein E6L09_11465 [Verrucomicrobia bacterium]|nr:MAG: hypothetical protein E6L09_11465 [Verrucomicrobiota bacterium]